MLLSPSPNEWIGEGRRIPDRVSLTLARRTAGIKNIGAFYPEGDDPRRWLQAAATMDLLIMNGTSWAERGGSLPLLACLRPRCPSCNMPSSTPAWEPSETSSFRQSMLLCSIRPLPAVLVNSAAAQRWSRDRGCSPGLLQSAAPEPLLAAILTSCRAEIVCLPGACCGLQRLRQRRRQAHTGGRLCCPEQWQGQPETSGPRIVKLLAKLLANV